MLGVAAGSPALVRAWPAAAVSRSPPMSIRFMAAMVVACGLSLAASARADEEKVALDKLPAAVSKAVKAKFPRGVLKDASKEVEKGKTIYEVALRDAGRNIDISLKDDGTIVEIETQIAAADLPRAVVDGLKAKYPNGKVKKAESVARGDQLSFEVILTDGDNTREIVLDPGGKITEDENGDED
jgi:hypothetical protein